MAPYSSEAENNNKSVINQAFENIKHLPVHLNANKLFRTNICTIICVDKPYIQQQDNYIHLSFKSFDDCVICLTCDVVHL